MGNLLSLLNGTGECSKAHQCKTQLKCNINATQTKGCKENKCNIRKPMPTPPTTLQQSKTKGAHWARRQDGDVEDGKVDAPPPSLPPFRSHICKVYHRSVRYEQPVS